MKKLKKIKEKTMKLSIYYQITIKINVFFQKIIVLYEINTINNHKIIVLNRQGQLKHRFISEIWKMNR